MCGQAAAGHHCAADPAECDESQQKAAKKRPEARSPCRARVHGFPCPNLDLDCPIQPDHHFQATKARVKTGCRRFPPPRLPRCIAATYSNQGGGAGWCAQKHRGCSRWSDTTGLVQTGPTVRGGHRTREVHLLRPSLLARVWRSQKTQTKAAGQGPVLQYRPLAQQHQAKTCRHSLPAHHMLVTSFKFSLT